jgi:hypothetical protein
LLEPLRNTAWIPITNGEFSAPTEVQVDTIAMREMFGYSLPYASIEIPERVAKLLRMKQDVSKSGLLDRLIGMASSLQIPELAQVTKLYALINAHLEASDLPHLQEEFKAKPLILATVNGQLQWTYMSERIIWGEGVPTEISEGFICLAKDYPPDLSHFFKKVGIPTTLQPRTALDYLVFISKEIPQKDTVEMLYKILAKTDSEQDKDFIRKNFQAINLIYVKGAKDFEWKFPSDIAWVDPFHPSGILQLFEALTCS